MTCKWTKIPIVLSDHFEKIPLLFFSSSITTPVGNNSINMSIHRRHSSNVEIFTNKTNHLSFSSSTNNFSDSFASSPPPGLDLNASSRCESLLNFLTLIETSSSSTASSSGNSNNFNTLVLNRFLFLLLMLLLIFIFIVILHFENLSYRTLLRRF